jgi:glycosyltransferase involved in cell wall biosynthesis
MKVSLVFRKQVPSFFSIEKVFEVVSANSTKNMFDKIVLPYTSRGLLSVFLNLLFLSRFRKGIFHITGDVHYAILALPKHSAILTIHDLIFLHAYKGLRRYILKLLFLDLPIKKAKWITTISEKSKREIIEFTGCSPDKILVIPNPVDTSITYVSREFNIHKPRLLFLGTKDNKNLDVAIASLFGIDLHLRIIGELNESQIELLNKYNIEFSVISNISKDRLAQEYTDADIVFFPSVYEGFGLPVIEGFQAGRPVLCSNISPMSEIAGDAAMLVDPYSISSIRNGVLNLIGDAALRSQLVSRGFEAVKKYQPDAIIKEYEALWEKLKP